MKYTTFEVTESIKGIAIIAVLLNHLINLHVASDFVGFANGIISVFFVFSGYGIYASLQKSGVSLDDIGIKFLVHYYIIKIFRIFPLYCIAVYIESTYFNMDVSILTYAGIKSPGHYWFINAILHCYLIAPFAYILVAKNRLITTLIVISLLLVIINFATFYALHTEGGGKDINDPFNLVYRGIVFSHVYVFIFGMLIAKALSLGQRNYVQFLKRPNIYSFVLSLDYTGSLINKLISVLRVTKASYN